MCARPLVHRTVRFASAAMSGFGRFPAMRIRQGAWGVAAVAVVGLAAVGCTGPTTHAASPSASPVSWGASPTPSAVEPTPNPPVPSAAMSSPSADGALAAAEYYMGLYVYSLATGDLAGWRTMSAADCKFCNGVIQDVEHLIAVGHTVSSAPLEFRSGYGTEVAPGELYGANFDASQDAWTELDSSGAVVTTGPASEVSMDFAIAWQNDGWLVRQVDVHEATATS